MEIFKKTILLLAMIVLPALCFAQPEVCKVTFTGKQPTILDYVRAYCSQSEAGSFEREALAAFTRGNTKRGDVECIVDTKNGYVHYRVDSFDGSATTLEMCYWNCDNKNEKLVAVNNIDSSLGFDESFLTFYRYNVKTKKMKLIKAPFDRVPEPIDLVDKDKADKATINMVLSAGNEDANKYQPSFSLPRTGKDITYRMADPTAIPETFQREGKLVWDGNGFCHED